VHPSRSAFAGLVVVIAALVAPGCKSEAVRACESGTQGALLSKALGADDVRSFDDALGRHGPVQASELPCLTDAATSMSSKKRRFAAQLMGLVRGDDPKAVRAAQLRVATETRDPVVWAELVRPLLVGELDDDAKPAVARADMVEKAMHFTDADDAKLQTSVQATGLRAGLRAHVAGIDDELKRRLDGRDETLVVALDALPAETAEEELPRLTAMLEAYEKGEKFPGGPGEVFAALVRALVRSGDAKAEPLVRAAMAKGYTNPRSIDGSREELSALRSAAVFQPEPEMRSFLLRVVRDGHTVAPLAFDVLSTQVWAAPRQAPSVELVTACAALLEPGWDATESIRSYEQLQCSHMLYFMTTGANPIDGSGPKVTPEAELAHARTWLAECQKSHGCAP
jgi:hypothetical protein